MPLQWVSTRYSSGEASRPNASVVERTPGFASEPGQDVVVEPAKEPVVRPLADHSAEQPDQHPGTVPNGADRARGYSRVRPVSSNEIAEPTAA